jgi:hypothetical protein
MNDEKRVTKTIMNDRPGSNRCLQKQSKCHIGCRYVQHLGSCSSFNETQVGEGIWRWVIYRKFNCGSRTRPRIERVSAASRSILSECRCAQHHGSSFTCNQPRIGGKGFRRAMHVSRIPQIHTTIKYIWSNPRTRIRMWMSMESETGVWDCWSEMFNNFWSQEGLFFSCPQLCTRLKELEGRERGSH